MWQACGAVGPLLGLTEIAWAAPAHSVIPAGALLPGHQAHVWITDSTGQTLAQAICMGGVCLWGTGGTHRACLLTAGVLHVVTWVAHGAALAAHRELLLPAHRLGRDAGHEVQKDDTGHQPEGVVCRGYPPR